MQTVLELPASARVGRRIIARAGISDRVRHVEGDLLTPPLERPRDVILAFWWGTRSTRSLRGSLARYGSPIASFLFQCASILPGFKAVSCAREQLGRSVYAKVGKRGPVINRRLLNGCSGGSTHHPPCTGVAEMCIRNATDLG